MKKIKVFYGDTRLKDIYPHATKFQVFKYKTAQLIRKVFMILVATAAVVSFVWIATDVQVTKRLAIPHFEANTEQKVELPPVMKRIAQCESGGIHYKKNGQVVTNANNNGSVDLGIFQINEKIWGAKAGEMKLDLTKEEDNIAMAMWIYDNFGTEDWIYSRKCWRY